jgi:hypothetical protein
VRSVSTGQAHAIQDWRELQSRFHVIVTEKVDVALSFVCSGLQPNDPFPLDLHWICATNKLLNQVNNDLHEWRSQETHSFGVVSAFTELIKRLSKCPRLSEFQRLNFIEMIDTADLPLNGRQLFEGDLPILLRNIDTRSGLAKDRRCCAGQMKNSNSGFSVQRRWNSNLDKNSAETIQFREFADRRARRRNCPDCCLWMWRLTAGDVHDLIEMCVRVM